MLLFGNEFAFTVDCMKRRNIEVLKVRFGEAALQVCEVMLRDMTDSKRIDQHIQSQSNEKTVGTITRFLLRETDKYVLKVSATSNHHFAPFLASPSDEHLPDAWAI